MTPDARPPGPRGAMSDAINLVGWRAKGMSFLAGIVATYGDIVSLNLRGYPLILVNDPELVRQVLVDHYDKLAKPESLKLSNRGHFGDGLTSLDAEAWRQRKRQMQPAFHSQKIARWDPIVVECTRAMLADWRPGDRVSVYRELVDLRARIAAQTVLGTDSVPDSDARGQPFQLNPDNSAPPFVGLRRPRASADSPHLLRIIGERFEGRPDDRQPGKDVLSYLVGLEGDDGPPMDREQITDELIQMFFAGHLTVPTWLTQLLYVLWARPDIAARVREEVRTALGDRPPTSPDLPRLPYAKQVIQETGRFFAPAPILYREIATTFSLAGYTLESGSGLWICPQLLHHDPRNFEAPHQFDPERFDPQHGGQFPRYAYLPFGAGPRICLGKAATLTEMQLVLTMICQACHLVPAPPVPSEHVPRLLAMPPPRDLIMQVEAQPEPA